MKYVQGEIIHRIAERSGGGGGIPWGKFLRGGLFSRGELFRGNCLGVVVSGEIIQR